MSSDRKASQRHKDEARAAYMKKHPGMFPDCFTRGMHPLTRAALNTPGKAEKDNSKLFIGIVGGIAAGRIFPDLMLDHLESLVE